MDHQVFKMTFLRDNLNHETILKDDIICHYSVNNMFYIMFRSGILPYNLLILADSHQRAEGGEDGRLSCFIMTKDRSWFHVVKG